MDHVGVLLPKIKNIPKNTNGRLAIPALAGLLVFFVDISRWQKFQPYSFPKDVAGDPTNKKTPLCCGLFDVGWSLEGYF